MSDALRLSEIAEAEPLVSWSHRFVDNLKLPMVYAWMRGERALYIGVSRGGASRPLSINHHRLKEAWCPGDTLNLWTFDEEETAITCEKKAILTVRPALNDLPVSGQTYAFYPAGREGRREYPRLRRQSEAFSRSATEFYHHVTSQRELTPQKTNHLLNQLKAHIALLEESVAEALNPRTKHVQMRGPRIGRPRTKPIFITS